MSTEVDLSSILKGDGPNIGDFIEIDIFFDALPKPDGQRMFLNGRAIQILAFLEEEIAGHAWYKDPFYLQPIIPAKRTRTVKFANHDSTDEEANGVPHLHCHIRVGEGLVDEWFIVNMLLRVCDEWRDISIQVRDADGEFLLIETADLLPSWLEPATSLNRVFLRAGSLCIVAPLGPGPVRSITLHEALDYLSNNEDRCIGNRRLQDQIRGKISRVLKGGQHKAIPVSCIMPRGIARLLLEYPNLVGVALDHIPPSTGSAPLKRSPVKDEQMPSFNFTKSDGETPLAAQLVDPVQVTLRLSRLQFSRLNRLRFRLRPAYSPSCWLCPLTAHPGAAAHNARVLRHLRSDSTPLGASSDGTAPVSDEALVSDEKLNLPPMRRGAQLCFGLSLACLSQKNLSDCLAFLWKRGLNGIDDIQPGSRVVEKVRSLEETDSVIRAITGPSADKLNPSQRSVLLRFASYENLSSPGIPSDTLQLPEFQSVAFAEIFREAYFRPLSAHSVEAIDQLFSIPRETADWDVVDPEEVDRMFLAEQAGGDDVHQKDEDDGGEVAKKFINMLGKKSDYTGVETLDDPVFQWPPELNDCAVEGKRTKQLMAKLERFKEYIKTENIDHEDDGNAGQMEFGAAGESEDFLFDSDSEDESVSDEEHETEEMSDQMAALMEAMDRQLNLEPAIHGSAPSRELADQITRSSDAFKKSVAAELDVVRPTSVILRQRY